MMEAPLAGAGGLGEKSSLPRYLYAVSLETPSFWLIAAIVSPSLRISRIDCALDMLIISFLTSLP